MISMKNIKFIYKGLLILSVLFIGILSNTIAQPVPENSNPVRLVVDQAGVFSQAEWQKLERELIAFSDSTSNQIVVVTLADLEGYEPWEVAQNIGQKWGVGRDGFDNGIVILIKPKVGNSRGQINIQVGYGLEGAIPDATTKMIVENEIIPLFKKGQMYRGVEAGIQVLKSLAVGEFNSDEYANTAGSNSGFDYGPILFFLFIIIFMFINKAGGARRYMRTNNVPFWVAMSMMSSGSGHGGSYGNFSSGGGGFGGFGGGGFGGGGAGGSW